MTRITLVVVDDHPLFRQGVVNALAIEPDFDVIGQAKDGEEGLELIRSLHPMVAIVDVNLPLMNGQQVTRQVGLDHLQTKVILLTAYDDQEQKIHAVRSGASAYCSKDIQPEKLADIIRWVIQGKHILGDQVMDTSQFQDWLADHADTSQYYYSDDVSLYSPLSTREMEVLNFVTKGMSNKEIAVLLGISHQTVKNHVTAILRKLGVEDRTQAAVYALRRGWVRLYQQNSQSQE